jgi:hypothetical protein
MAKKSDTGAETRKRARRREHAGVISRVSVRHGDRTRPCLWGHCCHDIVTHMKTTIDIADALLDQARAAADEDGTTLRALVEEALRQVLAQRSRRKPFVLRRASFKGRGLQPEWQGRDGDAIRRASYEGRGG